MRAPPNVYGRNDTSDRFVPIVFRKLALGEPITIYGKPKSLDFTYIDDTIDGLLRLMDRPAVADGRTFNLSRGRQATLVEVAEMIAELVGRPLELRIEDTRPGEVVHFEGDTTLAGDLLGYKPQVDIWDGLRRAAAWYAEHTLDAPPLTPSPGFATGLGEAPPGSPTLHL